MKRWYWVRIHGKRQGWSDDEMAWVTSEDGVTFVEGHSYTWNIDDLVICSGPFSDHDIDIAYFGYWV